MGIRTRCALMLILAVYVPGFKGVAVTARRQNETTRDGSIYPGHATKVHEDNTSRKSGNLFGFISTSSRKLPPADSGSSPVLSTLSLSYLSLLSQSSFGKIYSLPLKPEGIPTRSRRSISDKGIDDKSHSSVVNGNSSHEKQSSYDNGDTTINNFSFVTSTQPSGGLINITDDDDIVKRMEQTTSSYDFIKQHVENGPPKVLHIGGLFELTGKYGGNGYSELDAALLAISHINEKKIIPGYRLELLYNDSKCDPGVGTDAFFDFIYRKSNESSLIMVMGSACTEVTKTIAEIVPYWNLILISYAATSPALSEREKYRTFFRLALGDSALNPARRMLIKHFRWDKVAALYEDLESLSLAFNGINKDFTAHGIVVKSSTSFKDAAVEVPGKLKTMRDLDVRIIIAGFTEPAARQVFCEAYKQKMYGARYVWILVGGFKRQWWRDIEDTRCTPSQLAAAVEGVFGVFSLDGLLDGGKSVANLTSGEFLQAYFNANGSRPLSMFAASTYDTVWTMALTIRQATSEWAMNGTAPLLHHLSFDSMDPIKETFIDTMEDLEFPGVSGPVSFKGSDREGIAVVYQVQGGNFTQVAMHQPTSSSLDFNCDSCHKIIWHGNRVPKDEQIVVPRLKTIELSVFYTCTGLCVVGIFLAICFLTYNLYHRRLKFIKLSSPKLNNVAVIGCILVYTAVIMLGLDDRTLTDDIFPIVCSGRAFLLAAGFSLAFGAMFAKTFRVHQIFTRAHHGLVKSKLIQDTHLLVIIGVLLAVDSAIVFVWVIVDPMSRHVSNMTKEVSAEDEDLIFQEQLTTCHSNHLQKWLGAFYAYKGLLLIFGVYMAWETRNVKIPALNDSQYIGLNVYNAVIMSVSVVVISNILSNQPTLAYAMEAAFMFLSTTVTLCLLFVPKIYAIVTSGGNPIIASTGILVDNSNTRRFVFDDRKEIYYRAEVQNRVYKRELVELEQKINRLERLLEIPLQPYPRLTEELLYLLPESKVDGTPLCHRRHKLELERCNSISDGGEGVMIDISETDDILMEMAFGAPNLNQTSSITKRHSTVETSHKSNVKTLQKLTRSLSIGGSNGRGRRRKKGRDSCSKSSILDSSPEFSVLNDKSSIDRTAVNKCDGQNQNRYSDDLTYLSVDKISDFGCNQIRRNSSVPMLDKITQTSIDSASKRVHNEGRSGGGNGQAGRCEEADVHQNLCKNPRDSGSSYDGDNDEEDYLFYLGGGKNSQHPQHFPQKHQHLFAVGQLQIESAEDDSNSNNEDNESFDGSLNQRDELNTGFRLHEISDQEVHVNAQSSPNITTPSTKAVRATQKSRTSSASNAPRVAYAPAYHSQSISTPSQTAPTNDWSDLAPLELTPLAATTAKVSSPAQNTLCLTQDFVQPEVKIENCVDSIYHFNICYDDTESLPESPLLFSTPPNYYCGIDEDKSAQRFKGSKENNSNYSKTSVTPPASSPTPFRFSNEEVKQIPSLFPKSPETQNTPQVFTYQPQMYGSYQPSQMTPYQHQSSQIPLSYLPSGHNMEPTSSTQSKPSNVFQPSALGGTEQVATEQISQGWQAGYKNTKNVIEVERRKRIQKLQGDLIRIQKELEDLNDLEYDVSEV